MWSLKVIIHKMFTSGAHLFPVNSNHSKKSSMIKGEYRIDEQIKKEKIKEILNG